MSDSVSVSRGPNIRDKYEHGEYVTLYTLKKNLEDVYGINTSVSSLSRITNQTGTCRKTSLTLPVLLNFNDFQVTIAFIAILMNEDTFKSSPTSYPGPLVSSYVFLIALFLLLCELPIYPTSLRSLGFIAQGIFEVLIAAFIAETVTVDFWLPLEAAVMNNVSKLADIIDDLLSSGNWSCGTLCSILRKSATRYVLSYTLSTFFLMTVLHATRIIDLRVMEYGIVYFFKDVVYKIKTTFKRQYKLVTSKIKHGLEKKEDSITNIMESIEKQLKEEKTPRKIQKRRPQSARRQKVASPTVPETNAGDNLETMKRQTRSSSSCPSEQMNSDKEPPSLYLRTRGRII